MPSSALEKAMPARHCALCVESRLAMSPLPKLSTRSPGSSGWQRWPAGRYNRSVRGDINLDGVGHGVHAGVCDQLLGHGLNQVRIDDGDVRGDLESAMGYDALLVIGDDGECGHLGGGAGGGRRWRRSVPCGATAGCRRPCISSKGDLRNFMLDPHGLCGVNGGTAAHGDDPVRLELQHGLSTAHDGLDRGSGSMPSNSSTSMPASFSGSLSTRSRKPDAS